MTTDWETIPLLISAAHPATGTVADAAQDLADVAAHPALLLPGLTDWPMRCELWHMPLPPAETEADPGGAVFACALHVQTGPGRPPAEDLVNAAHAAMRSRLGPGAELAALPIDGEVLDTMRTAPHLGHYTSEGDPAAPPAAPETR